LIFSQSGLRGFALVDIGLPLFLSPYYNAV
jgi:hypothetical protein